MNYPASKSGMNDGYGAYTCDTVEYAFPFIPYIEIQIHPGDVRAEYHASNGGRIVATFTDATVRTLCVNLCEGGDCVGQVADAIEECENTHTASLIALQLRKCGELLAKWYKEVERNKKAKESRKAREDAMRSLGLQKVRGNLGGTYWE